MRISSDSLEYEFSNKMEESSLPHQNGGPPPQSVINNKQNDDNSQRTQYTIPGILHFIQHEWARFELERSQWEVDRAELQARIAFLQGERKGQENLKSDLVRRIKMLEYALKQERQKYHKLKYGVDLPMAIEKPPMLEEGAVESATDQEYTRVSNATWRQGRQLLRQYLQEIGYTDMIIDVRNLRVKSLLGLNNNAEQEENHNSSSVNGNETNKRVSDNQGRRTPAKKSQPGSIAESMLLETEAAVMANFEFLSNVADVDMDEDDISDEADIDPADELENTSKFPSMLTENIVMKDEVDAEAEDVLNELNLLTESADSMVGMEQNWNRQTQANANRMKFDKLEDMEENLDTSLGLGELAQLTVNNDAESSYDITTNKEAFRKTWTAKYTLRSHFDGVRALVFHPIDPVLITGSEDHTLKLWNLQKTVPAKKSSSLDVEPLYTFRAHNCPVLCLAISGDGNNCYSGGIDGTINCWNLPNANMDPYDSFEPEIFAGSLDGHTDAVWGLSYSNARQQLLSSSADGTVKLWSPSSKVPLLSTFNSEFNNSPCSADFIKDETGKIVVSYSNDNCVIYDLETTKEILKFELTQDILSNKLAKLINKIVCHPTLSLTITAHDDRHIRFWDNNTGKLVHSMVAHLEAVTSLAVDPNGLYLLSGSHDCSIRLWHLDNKTCVQEITAHRKKFDESILDVAFHPSRPYIASAGADGLAKVFV